MEIQETLGEKREVTKVTVWLVGFSRSSHLPILISIKRKGSSPYQVRGKVHEHMAGWEEDTSQPL